MIARLFAAFSLLASTAATADAWQLETIETAGRLRELVVIGDEPHVATTSGWFRVVAAGKSVRLEPAPAPHLPPLPPGALPDARIAAGKREIGRAWFAQPTTRYRHGVLGERAGRFAVLAETPSIGTPHRWLNPAGVADFDGDGAIEIAFVRMPHALGRLELWRWQSGKLVLAHAVGDTSNHAIGSRALKQSAVADFDGDGIADLAIPSFDRRAIRLLSFRGGVREIARVPLPAAPGTDFALVSGTAMPEILFGVTGGQLVRLRR